MCNVHFNICFIFHLSSSKVQWFWQPCHDEDKKGGGGGCFNKIFHCVSALTASVPLGLAEFYSTEPQAGRSKPISEQSVKLLACDP